MLKEIQRAKRRQAKSKQFNRKRDQWEKSSTSLVIKI